MDTAVYDAWGLPRADVDANVGGAETWQDPVGWGGQWGYYNEAETGLVLLGHRYYDPYRARFLTRDPLGYGAGPNLYTFCGGDPINNIDPDGTQEAPTDSMAYIGNMFNNLTPHDWLHALKHNDATRAVVAMANMAAWVPLPENPVADAKAVEGVEALARAGEDLYVGTYGSAKYGLKKAGNLADYTPHHVVQDAVSGTTTSKGITITLKRSIHEGLETTGVRARNLPSQRHHLAADLNELRGALRQNGYNRSIVNRQLQELSRRNKALGGFNKPSP